MKMKAAQAMVECLKAEGISTVYGYPGAAICPFYDALLDAKDEITHVLVRHEANGGHAASGFARISGRPAVCTVIWSTPRACRKAYIEEIP